MEDVSKLETNSCVEVPKIKCSDVVVISLDLLHKSYMLPFFSKALKSKSCEILNVNLKIY